MGAEYKILQNENLHRIQEILIPQDSENDTFTIPPSSSSSKSSSIANTTSSTEFIPHIFYTLYQIQKDPNNSNNQLENKTGLIRHRLRNCKNLIKENDDSIELLSKSTEEWDQFINNRENELQIKKNVLLNIRSKISEILTKNDYVRKEETEDGNGENHVKIEDSTQDDENHAKIEDSTQDKENHTKMEDSAQEEENKDNKFTTGETNVNEELKHEEISGTNNENNPKSEEASETVDENHIKLDSTTNDNNSSAAVNDLPANTKPTQQPGTLTENDENELDDFDMEL